MFKEINNREYISLNLQKYYNLGNNPYVKCIAYFKHNCLGFVVFSLIYDRIEIEYIYVEKEYRHQNIGTKLLQYVEKIGLDNKCDNISLEVSIENINAIKLYEKCGFYKVATREIYYSGVDGLLMLKKLVNE